MPTPLFSVIIPCYRASATVYEAVQSVLAQRGVRLELIVVEDGCPEASADAALLAAAGDPRLRVLRQANAGVSAARNAGLAVAQGAYVAFLDADDRWVPDALAQHARAFAANPQLGLSFGLVRFYDPLLLRPGRLSAAQGQMELAEVLGENPACTASNLVFRRAVLDQLGGFDATLRHAEDQELMARVLAQSDWQVAGLPVEMVHYRTSVGGLSADLRRMEQGWCAMLDRLAPSPALAAARPGATALFRRYLARRALRTGQAGAWRYLARGFGASPLALLRHQPRRSLMTAAGALASILLPGCLANPLLSR